MKIFLYTMAILFLSISTLAISVGTYTDHLRSGTSISRILLVKPGLRLRKVEGLKGDCLTGEQVELESLFRNRNPAWFSVSKATCAMGEVAVAGGIEKVFNEPCHDDNHIEHGFTMESHQDEDDPKTWYVLYHRAKIQAYAICVAAKDL